MKRAIKDFSITWTADHNQYWQGHGIGLSDWDECATGAGETLAEALDDALESLAQNGIEITDEQEKAMRDQISSELREGYTIETNSVEAECDENGSHNKPCDECDHTSVDCEACEGSHLIPDEDPDCAVCAGDWRFYVSVDVKVSGEKEEGQ